MIVLRDRNQHVMGRIEETYNGRQEARDHDNRRLGYYDPVRDLTFDADGHRVGSGNQLGILIGQAV